MWFAHCGRYCRGLPASYPFQPPSSTFSYTAVFGKLRMILLDSFAARGPGESWVLPIRCPHARLEFGRKAGCVVQIVADHSRSRVILQSSALRFLTSASGNSSGNCPDRKGGSVNLGPEVVPGNSTYHVLLLLFWYHLIHSKNPFSLKLAMMALLLQLNINPWSHIQNILTCPSSSL